MRVWDDGYTLAGMMVRLPLTSNRECDAPHGKKQGKLLTMTNGFSPDEAHGQKEIPSTAKSMNS